MQLDEYGAKDHQKAGWTICVLRVPPKEVLAEFFWIFEERVNLENDAFIGKMKCVNNYEASLETFLNSKPLFHGYDSFTEYALKNGG